jgi:hypothetical protein
MFSDVSLNLTRMAAIDGDAKADLFGLFYVMVKTDVAEMELDLPQNFATLGA